MTAESPSPPEPVAPPPPSSAAKQPASSSSSPPPPPEPEPEDEEPPQHDSSILKKVEGKTRDFVESNEIRGATSTQEFLTQNTLKLIGKTYAFILIVLGMFLVVALIRESIVMDILPVITLIVGGVLGFLSKDILSGNNNSTTGSTSSNNP